MINESTIRARRLIARKLAHGYTLIDRRCPDPLCDLPLILLTLLEVTTVVLIHNPESRALESMGPYCMRRRESEVRDLLKREAS